MAKVIVGLGSNRGDRLANLRWALLELKAVASLHAVSPVYESEAMLPEGAPAEWNRTFFNLAAEVETTLAPESLLAAVKKIEAKLGRSSAERWAPREIDLDLLALERGSYRAAGLEIPHPGLAERPFALLPLLDLWPEYWAGPHPWLWSETRPFNTRKTTHALTRLMGIVNVTPDSFSGDGVGSDLARAEAQIERLIGGGAAILDFGAESTRPGGTPLTPGEEWSRLGPVFESLVPRLKGRAIVSLDSRHPETIKRALGLGVQWINDVTGAGHDEIRAAAREHGAKLVAMHSLTVPVVRERVLSDDKDPVETVLAWGFEKLRELRAAGLRDDQIVLDPGIGFGKTPQQNLHLLNEAWRFHAWGVEVLIGHSRKSFMGRFTALPPAERDLETALLSARLARQGIEYLRVHEPALSERAIGTFQFLR
ncbi:MAG TPA: dihydropteroate synthase [Bdellovibrionales bacterium]|nr:dihydropteroate synthase [Bdellovibrionales bacterium]